MADSSIGSVAVRDDDAVDGVDLASSLMRALRLQQISNDNVLRADVRESARP
jgi:hypothetical protein